MAECPARGCGRPTTGALCSRCVRWFARDVVATPSAWRDLVTTYTRQDRLSTQAPGTGARPLPWNERAVGAMTELRGAVWALSASATGTRLPMTGDALIGAQRPDVGQVARGLIERLPRLVATPGIHWSADRLSSALRGARRVCDRPEYDRRFYVGPCPQPTRTGERGYCSGEVWAFIPTRETERSLLSCATCEHVWPAERWMRAGRLIARRARVLARGGGDTPARAEIHQRDQGRYTAVLVDRAALLRMSGRAQSVISRHCVPVASSVHTHAPLYDAEQALAILGEVPTRTRTG